MNIRIATNQDWPSIAAIYNQAVDEDFCTADTDPITVEDRLDWFSQHSPNAYPIFVADQDGCVSGWCSLSPYRPGRKALRTVSEISYYVGTQYKNMGIGSGLIEHAIGEAPKLGFKNLFAILLDRNDVSVRLLEKHGFKKWGHLPDIADFNGTICGQFIYGRKVE